MTGILIVKGEKMNKAIILLAMIALLPCHAFGQNASNYEITINGEIFALFNLSALVWFSMSITSFIFQFLLAFNKLKKDP